MPRNIKSESSDSNATTHVEVIVAHHVVRVYALEERNHHIDPTSDGRLAIGTPRLVDEIPGEDGGVIFVNTPIHCRRRESATGEISERG